MTSAQTFSELHGPNRASFCLKAGNGQKVAPSLNAFPFLQCMYQWNINSYKYKRLLFGVV